MMMRARQIGCVGAIVIALLASHTARGDGKGFALNRYEATAAGEPSFLVDYPWYSKTRWFAGGLTLNYAHNPLTYGYRLASDGQYHEVGPIVANQLSLHVDLAASFLDRITIALSLPITLFENGAEHDGVRPLSGAAVGDLRLGVMARLFGQAYESKFSLHLGLAVWIPWKKWPTVGESSVRVMPKLLAAGFWKGLRYSLALAFYYRPEATIGASAGPETGAGLSITVQTPSVIRRSGSKVSFASRAPTAGAVPKQEARISPLPRKASAAATAQISPRVASPPREEPLVVIACAPPSGTRPRSRDRDRSS